MEQVILLLLLAASYALEDIKCVNQCVIVDVKNGRDNSSCLLSANNRCKTLRYVFNNAATALNSTMVVLQGHHQLDQTLTVSNVESLTIEGAEKALLLSHVTFHQTPEILDLDLCLSLSQISQ